MSKWNYSIYKKMEQKDILKFISECKDREFLLEMNGNIVSNLNNSRLETSSNFSVGQNVEFDGKFGRVYKGVIIKINRKSIKVEVEDGPNWNCSPSLLRAL